MKVITTDKFNDREYISIFGICIYYCRELDDGYKKKFLCFRWFKRKNTIERKIDSILNELQKIGSKGKMSKLAAETDFENLPFEEIQKNSVLLIESNNFHSETLPGIARYFIDLDTMSTYCFHIMKINLTHSTGTDSKKYALNQFKTLISAKF